MIRLESIHKVFQKGTPNETIALSDISFLFPSGSFTMVIGSNGSGKSTLLNIISGTLKPSAGKVFINDEDVTTADDFERSKYISRVFQDPLSGTAPDLSIIDNLRLASQRTRAKGFKLGINDEFRKEAKEKVSLLDLGLENKLDQPMRTLSGGQRQALTLVMAVMDSSKVLLMDEPTAALDPRTSDHLMELAEKIIKEFDLTGILVTHNLKHVQRYGDRLLLMEEGHIKLHLEAAEKKQLEAPTLFGWFS